MQNSSMCEVEYIMESVPVGLGNIIQEWIAYARHSTANDIVRMLAA